VRTEISEESQSEVPFRYGGSLCLGTLAWLTYCRWYEYVNVGRRSLAYVVCGTTLQRTL